MESNDSIDELNTPIVYTSKNIYKIIEMIFLNYNWNIDTLKHSLVVIF